MNSTRRINGPDGDRVAKRPKKTDGGVGVVFRSREVNACIVKEGVPRPELIAESEVGGEKKPRKEAEALVDATKERSRSRKRPNRSTVGEVRRITSARNAVKSFRSTSQESDLARPGGSEEKNALSRGEGNGYWASSRAPSHLLDIVQHRKFNEKAQAMLHVFSVGLADEKARAHPKLLLKKREHDLRSLTVSFLKPVTLLKRGSFSP